MITSTLAESSIFVQAENRVREAGHEDDVLLASTIAARDGLVYEDVYRFLIALVDTALQSVKTPDEALAHVSNVLGLKVHELEDMLEQHDTWLLTLGEQIPFLPLLHGEVDVDQRVIDAIVDEILLFVDLDRHEIPQSSLSELCAWINDNNINEDCILEAYEEIDDVYRLKDLIVTGYLAVITYVAEWRWNYTNNNAGLAYLFNNLGDSLVTIYERG